MLDDISLVRTLFLSIFRPIIRINANNFFSIQTHLTFGKEFTQAVELKQVAQQEAEKARFVVEKAEQLKKAAVISAEGDSKAAELLAKAFGDSGEALVELRRIEAAEEIATNLARARNVVYLPSKQGTLLNLPQ